jgi:OmcA/MtrC family decaheme c-type cytochrome
MTGILRAIVILATVGTISFPNQPPQVNTAAPSSARRRAVGSPTTPATPARPGFAANQIEFYLGDEGVAYIRPGLKIKVNSITIGTDRKAVVDLSYTDDLGNPLDRTGKITPGAISTSLVLAWYNPATRQYVSYTTRSVTTPANSPRPGVKAVQAAADTAGATSWTDLETGRAKYAFTTALPADFDVTKTHTLGIYATRSTADLLGKNYYANLEYDFRPDGAKVVETWAKTNDATSCANCHDTAGATSGLGMHGGSRRDVKLCVLCHTPQTTDPDTGNTVDMKVMIHKIHSGSNLKTPYIIIGNAQSVNDFSEVTFPQDRRNCDNCHEGTDATKKPAQSNVWYTNPSRAACGACHDDINWETGENHPAGPQANDVACATCHVPDSGEEFDASIKGAHTIPEKSKQLKGLKVEILSWKDMKPGLKPTVTYKITDNSGKAIDGTKLNSFNPICAGPTSSYTSYYRESALTKGVFDAAAGTTTYTFTNPIAAGATGTYVLSADTYRNVTIARADGKTGPTVRECAINPIKYVAVTGTTATPRRTIVAMDKCNSCHDRLALHGGQRLVIEECVICHNPTMDDKAQRVAEEGLPESISLQRLIHRIHSGTELSQDYTIFGNGKSRNNFNEVTFPGDRRNCMKCHVNAASYNLPPTSGDAVVTQRDWFSPQGPGTAACLGCHDSKDAAAHAYLNTTTFKGLPAEACATCHSATHEWGVDKVHAR